MLEDLEINSFDDLKTALGEALHNGAASPEAADYLMERFEVLCMDIDNVFLAISANDIKEYYPNLSLDEAREVRDNANENLWNSGGYDDINDGLGGKSKPRSSACGMRVMTLVAKRRVSTTLLKRMAMRVLAKKAAARAIRRASRGRCYFCPLGRLGRTGLHASH